MITIKVYKGGYLKTDGQYITDNRWIIDTHKVSIKFQGAAKTEIEDAVTLKNEYSQQGDKLADVEKILKPAFDYFYSKNYNLEIDYFQKLFVFENNGINQCICATKTQILAFDTIYSFIYDCVDFKLFPSGNGNEPYLKPVVIYSLKTKDVIGLIMPMSFSKVWLREKLQKLSDLCNLEESL